MAGAALMREGPVPERMANWWEPSMYCLHCAPWWRAHWGKAGIVKVDVADSMPDGWRFWLQWQRVVAPENLTEICALESDAGDYLGYVRAVARRREDAKLEDIIHSVPTTYSAQPLRREVVKRS